MLHRRAFSAALVAGLSCGAAHHHLQGSLGLATSQESCCAKHLGAAALSSAICGLMCCSLKDCLKGPRSLAVLRFAKPLADLCFRA